MTDLVILAVHDCFKHAAGQEIFLLDWRQVLSYDVSFLNICIVVNSVINLVNKNLPRTVVQICMYVSFQFESSTTRRHGNFAGVHTLLRILLSSNSAVLFNIITGVSPPHFDFFCVLCSVSMLRNFLTI
jgi:hypothetical protein